MQDTKNTQKKRGNSGENAGGNMNGKTGKNASAPQNANAAAKKSAPRATKSALPPARALALDCLQEIYQSDAQAQAALDAALQKNAVSSQDAALATELVYGCLRMRMRLSWLVWSFLRGGSKLPPELLRLLEMAVYELLFLERVPHYATLGWTVAEVRRRWGQGLSRLATAVLRGVERLEDAPNHAEWFEKNIADAAKKQDLRLHPVFVEWFGKGAGKNAEKSADNGAGNAAEKFTDGKQGEGTGKHRKNSAPCAPLAPLSADNAFLSVWYSVPPWLVTLWLNAYGKEEACALLAASLTVPPVGVRVNALRPDADDTRAALLALQGACAMVSEYAMPYALYFTEGRHSAELAPLLADGKISLQSVASQEVLTRVLPYIQAALKQTEMSVLPAEAPSATILGASSGIVDVVPALASASDSAPAPAAPASSVEAEPAPATVLGASSGVVNVPPASASALVAPVPSPAVWDCCSGRGGKTCMLAECGIAPILASDTHAGRLGGLVRELERLHIPVDAVRVMTASATEPPLGMQPRIILADVPCSGLGTMARRPDVRWHRKPADIAGLCDIQRQIADTAWQTLPQGGLLLYVTCTRNPAENEEQISALMARQQIAPEKLLCTWSSPSNSLFAEFFFAACLQK